jgi:hypothetical protein
MLGYSLSMFGIEVLFEHEGEKAREKHGNTYIIRRFVTYNISHILLS